MAAGQECPALPKAAPVGRTFLSALFSRASEARALAKAAGSTFSAGQECPALPKEAPVGRTFLSAPFPGASAARPNAGFTLLEVIVATALMGIAVVGLLSLVTQSLGNAARVRQYDRAAMLARTQMDALLTMTPLPVGRRLEGDFDNSSGWEAVAEPWEVPGGAQPGASMLVRVGLTVWWQADGRRNSVAMDGFRRVRIGEQ